GRERELFRIGLLEAGGETAHRRFAPRLLDHCGREVHADDMMTASRQLQGEESRAAADVERLEAGTAVADGIPDAGPRRASPAARSPVVRMLWPKSSSKLGARRFQCVATCCLTASIRSPVMASSLSSWSAAPRRRRAAGV